MSTKSLVAKTEFILKMIDNKGAYDVRNFIAHDYLGVDLGLVEGVVRDYLPTLKIKIEVLRDEYTKANNE